MIDKLAVITPDYESGRAFRRTLEKSNVRTEAIIAKISPRVVSDIHGYNQFTPNSRKVSLDLATAIYDSIEKGLTLITIACNTLSLDLFVKPALEILSEIGIQHSVDFMLTTTLKSLTINRCTMSSGAQLFTGTTPTCIELEKFGFNTMFREDMELQILTQEVIWRTKAIFGMDYSTASTYISKIDDKESYEILLNKYFERINAQENYDEIILGCTELPIAVNEAQRLGMKIEKVLINPAEVLANNINSGSFISDQDLFSSETPQYSKGHDYIENRAYLNQIALIE